MIDLIRQRRSIRKFTAQPVEGEKLSLLKEAALRSPASKSSNAWEFIFVDDSDLLKALATSKPFGSKMLESAPLGVVVMADPEKTEAWIEDCSVASTFLQLTAQSLKLGSCWVQICGRQHSEAMTAEDYVKELLGIPSHLRVLSIVAIGTPAQERSGIDASELQWEKIRTNRY